MAPKHGPAPFFFRAFVIIILAVATIMPMIIVTSKNWITAELKIELNNFQIDNTSTYTGKLSMGLQDTCMEVDPDGAKTKMTTCNPNHDVFPHCTQNSGGTAYVFKYVRQFLIVAASFLTVTLLVHAYVYFNVEIQRTSTFARMAPNVTLIIGLLVLMFAGIMYPNAIDNYCGDMSVCSLIKNEFDNGFFTADTIPRTLFPVYQMPNVTAINGSLANAPILASSMDNCNMRASAYGVLVGSIIMCCIVFVLNFIILRKQTYPAHDGSVPTYTNESTSLLASGGAENVAPTKTPAPTSSSSPVARKEKEQPVQVTTSGASVVSNDSVMRVGAAGSLNNEREYEA